MTDMEAEGGGAAQRTLNIPQFCRRYGLSRSKTYQEIRQGRLLARKCGDRTLITKDAAEAWLHALPAFHDKQRAKGERS